MRTLDIFLIKNKRIFFRTWILRVFIVKALALWIQPDIRDFRNFFPLHVKIKLRNAVFLPLDVIVLLDSVDILVMRLVIFIIGWLYFGWELTVLKAISIERLIKIFAKHLLFAYSWQFFQILLHVSFMFLCDPFLSGDPTTPRVQIVWMNLLRLITQVFEGEIFGLFLYFLNVNEEVVAVVVDVLHVFNSRVSLPEF